MSDPVPSSADTPPPQSQPSGPLVENASDTLIVPPPGFRERLLAAQRARAAEVRPSTDLPAPNAAKIPLPSVKGETKSLATAPGNSPQNLKL